MAHRPTSFFATVWQGAVPLLVWAGHFLVSYGAVALGCDQGWGRGVWGGTTVLHAALLAFGALACLVLVCLLMRSCGRLRARPGGLLPLVRVTTGALALVAVVWTSVPLWALPACHFN